MDYVWPEDRSNNKDPNVPSCHTCTHAIITIVSECTLKNKDRSWFHPNGMCPEEYWCQYYEKADDFTIRMNGVDWSKARRIDVD